MQNNNIIDFLDLEDANVRITNIEISGDQKIVTLETIPYRHYCPVCGTVMHSRGVKICTIHHPILQDTYELVIRLRQRRWKCTVIKIEIIAINTSNGSLRSKYIRNVKQIK